MHGPYNSASLAVVTTKSGKRVTDFRVASSSGTTQLAVVFLKEGSQNELAVFCVQAFIMGWTSDLVPKIVYEMQVGNGTLTGYVNHSLAVFDTADLTNATRPDPRRFEHFPLCR